MFTLPHSLPPPFHSPLPRGRTGLSLWLCVQPSPSIEHLKHRHTTTQQYNEKDELFILNYPICHDKISYTPTGYTKYQQCTVYHMDKFVLLLKTKYTKYQQCPLPYEMLSCIQSTGAPHAVGVALWTGGSKPSTMTNGTSSMIILMAWQILKQRSMVIFDSTIAKSLAFLTRQC